LKRENGVLYITEGDGGGYRNHDRRVDTAGKGGNFIQKRSKNTGEGSRRGAILGEIVVTEN